MTLDDLSKLHYDAWFKIANTKGGVKIDADRAGIRAVVDALRDEFIELGNSPFLKHMTGNDLHEASLDWLNEILGSDAGVKAAGESATAVDGQQSQTDTTSSAAVCVWTLRASGWEFDLYDACGDKPLKSMLTTQKRCQRCGLPIQFKEQPL